MARLCAPPKNTLLRDLPEKDKIKLALEWLHKNPDEKPATAACVYHIKKENSVQKAWVRARRRQDGGSKGRHRGHNKILRLDQHQALIRYAINQATNRGKGATKQMMYNCAMWLRFQEGKTVPS
jgi:hypothetical protein